MVATEDGDYSGTAAIPAGDAAFAVAVGSTGTIVGNVAVGAAGNDGNTWRQIN